MSAPQFYRMAQLATRPGQVGRYPFSPATIWRWIKAGTFPAPIRLGPGIVAWRGADLEAWEVKNAQREDA